MFTWSFEEMPGISPEVDQHWLNIVPKARPVRQRPRKFALDQLKAIDNEVDRLKKVRFITKVQYLRWL